MPFWKRFSFGKGWGGREGLGRGGLWWHRTVGAERGELVGVSSFAQGGFFWAGCMHQAAQSCRACRNAGSAPIDMGRQSFNREGVG